MGVGAEVCRLAPGDDAMNGSGKRRKAMVGLFAAAVLGAVSLALLVQSDAKSDALAGLEADAMAAAGKGDLEGARRILTGAD